MQREKGQILITVILIGLIAVVAVLTASAAVISQLRRNASLARGISQYELTYGLMENAFMQLLRNPNYTGETITLNSVPCTVTVSGSGALTVLGLCNDGSFIRKIQATVTFTNGVMGVSNIVELP